MERTAGDGSNQPNTLTQNTASEQHLPQRYRFSPEETRVLKECNRESFWFRSIPIATGLSSLVYFAIKRGYLAASPRWGPAPKMFSAAVIGYFVGKVSYQTACMEKIMQLPNSVLGEHLRKQRGRLGFTETLSMDPAFSSIQVDTGAAQTPPDAHVYSDVMDTRAYVSTFDSETPVYSGLEYNKPIDSTEQMLNDENLPPKRPQLGTTYDDLRRQNRVDYELGRHAPSSPQQPQQPTEPPRRSTPSSASREPAYSPKKNIYGDIWEDAEPRK